MPRLNPRHTQTYAAREHAAMAPAAGAPASSAHSSQHHLSPWVFDTTAIAIGVTVGLLALLALAIMCLRHRRRPNCASATSPKRRLRRMTRSCSFRNACPAAACPPRRRKHPLHRLAGKLPWPPRARKPTTELPDASDDEEALLKTQQDDEEAGQQQQQRQQPSGAASSSAAAAGDTATGDGPQPLPPPAVLDTQQPTLPRPHYSHLELRMLEGDGDTSHCWDALPPRHVQVRGEGYLSDGQKAPGEPASLCLAVELFRSSVPLHDVARRADSPAHSLQRRSAQPLDSVFVVNLIIPATDGYYQARARAQPPWTPDVDQSTRRPAHREPSSRVFA